MKIIYTLLIFVSGFFVFFLLTYNDSSEIKTNIYSENLDHNQLQQIQNQQEKILTIILGINHRLDIIENNRTSNHLSEKRSDIEIAPNTKDQTKLTKKQKKTILSDEEIQQTKYQIFDSLLSATMTVPEALKSSKLNALPETEKLELIKEIVKRYNSGELPR